MRWGGCTSRQRRSSASGDFNIWLSDLLHSEAQKLPARKRCSSLFLPPPPPSPLTTRLGDHRRRCVAVATPFAACRQGTPVGNTLMKRQKRGRGGRKGGETNEGGGRREEEIMNAKRVRGGEEEIRCEKNRWKEKWGGGEGGRWSDGVRNKSKSRESAGFWKALDTRQPHLFKPKQHKSGQITPAESYRLLLPAGPDIY